MLGTALAIAVAGALGAFSGALGGLFGIGGGAIAIPLLGIVFGLHQQAAQGTTLLMVAPNVLFGFWRYRQRFGVDLRMAAAIAGGALVSTYPAARLATGLDPHALRLAFAIFLAAHASLIACRTRRNAPVSPSRPPFAWGWTALVGAAGGVVSGFFGVGGAFIAPPALTAFLGLRQTEAQGLALALVCPGTIVALAAYAETEQADWVLGIPLALGGIAAISAGVGLAHRLPERRLRLGFCALLLVTAALLAVRG